MKLNINLGRNSTKQQKDLIELLIRSMIESDDCSDHAMDLTIRSLLSDKNVQLSFNYDIKFSDLSKISHRVSIFKALVQEGVVTSINVDKLQEFLFWIDTINEDVKDIINTIREAENEKMDNDFI